MNFTWSIRYSVVFGISFLGTFFSLYFFTNNIAASLNTSLPIIPAIGQLIFPNPQGSAYYSGLYSLFVAFFISLPFAAMNPPKDWDVEA